MKITKLILFYFFLISSSFCHAAFLDDDFKAIWAGTEVIGTDQERANKIRAIIPFQNGDIFIMKDIEKYRSVCNICMKKYFPEEKSTCQFIFFGDGNVYLDIEFLPKNEKRKIFRTIPWKIGKQKKLPKELLTLYNAWYERDSQLKTKGIFAKEKYDRGFRDYEDPVLHSLSEKLAELCFKYNHLLMDIIHYSQDVNDRRKAAVLLSWSQHPENMTSILKWNILMDPDASVRNNTARAFTFLINDMHNQNLLKKLIPAYCKQATLPSHTDRNKAMVSLFKIVEAEPQLVSSIDSECRKTINYISEISILDNVGGFAKKIKNKIEGFENV